MNQRLLRFTSSVSARFTQVIAPERGDVPGWVLITLMTAGLPVISEIGQ